jgi:hypothetical protein
MGKEFADFPRSGSRTEICSVKICSAFGDIERINDQEVKCTDHGTIFQFPVEVRPEKADETSSKTFIEDHGEQL